ncbi:hypothetical protein TA3x_001991 [Tundrisphaera sp. TA3]|uniref:hypothetical protein n=1 Tax=Tundrisphaera sp. TA3 TaxID=3435775 RepID=UPI003EBA3D53
MANVSDWELYRMEDSVRDILKDAPTHPNHDTGHFFMTTFQIAIEFARRYQDSFDHMGRSIGGAGAGNDALTIYLAGQLSRRIKAGSITDIEMQFLHSANMKSLMYKHGGGDIVATPNDAGFPNTMFRIRH